VANRTEFRRLTLQIERDLLVKTSLRTLLASADATLERHRRSLRTVSARIKRAAMKAP
jgi:hypothetical protein